MTTRATNTPCPTGSIRAVSTGPGSGRPRQRAQARLSPSQQAPATCPPSSGRSGTRLKANRARLSEPSRLSIDDTRAEKGIPTPSLETSPAILPTPTRLTRPPGLRCSRPRPAATEW